MKRTIYLFTPTSARMFTDGVAQSGRCIKCRVAQLVEHNQQEVIPTVPSDDAAIPVANMTMVRFHQHRLKLEV